MAGFSETTDERNEERAAGANGSSEFANEFLSKIWTDLGWGLNQKQPTAQTPEAVIFGPKVPEDRHGRPEEQPPDAPFSPKDQPETLPPPESTTGGQIFELRNLKNRAADHKTPDAEVRLPAGFDPSKPIHLVIYNHGFGSTVRTAFDDNKLDEQMANAPANTVLIVPEWQRKPGANSGDQGHFADANVFRDMVQEIFDKTPGLNGKTWKDVDTIGLLAYSAGYGPSETEINKNGVGNKVTSITLLDALYDNHGFDDWIKHNANDLKAGTKRFYNFFYDTSKYSMQLVERAKQMLPGVQILEDYKNGDAVMDADALAKHSVVFKYSTATVPELGPHWSMPHLYVAPVETAAKQIFDK